MEVFIIKLLLFILLAHITGDYLFQSDYIASNKGRDMYILFVHSILYSFGVMIVGDIMGYEFMSKDLIFISLIHMPVDYIKAKGITPKYIGNRNALILDQLVHYLTLLFIVTIRFL